MGSAAAQRPAPPGIGAAPVCSTAAASAPPGAWCVTGAQQMAVCCSRKDGSQVFQGLAAAEEDAAHIFPWLVCNRHLPVFSASPLLLLTLYAQYLAQ